MIIRTITLVGTAQNSLTIGYEDGVIETMASLNEEIQCPAEHWPLMRLDFCIEPITDQQITAFCWQIGMFLEPESPTVGAQETSNILDLMFKSARLNAVAKR